MQGSSQLDACQEAINMGMTQEQYEKYLAQKKEIEEQYGEEDKDEEEEAPKEKL